MSRLRPTVHSFDLFDTLIARRCVSPFAVFSEVERTLSAPGFANLRHGAERILAESGKSFGLDAIYAVLVDSGRVGGDDAARLKQAEIECEFDNALPINANLAQITDGDLVVSDMYLPPETLRRLLNHVGWRGHIHLFVSNSGKRNGTIWPRLSERWLIASHLGDDSHSDVATPAQHGIPIRHFTGAQASANEQAIAAAGFVALARTVRALRLSSPYRAESPEGELWSLATGHNLPLLLLFAAELRRRRDKLQRTHLLFSARDCYFLADLFGVLYPTEPASYFHVSRELLAHADAKTQRYLNEAGLDSALVCDIAATGASWYQAAMARTTPPAVQTLVFIDNWALSRVAPEIIASGGKLSFGWLLRSSEMSSYSTALEVLNLAPHGTCTGVSGELLLVPHLENTDEFPPELVRLLLRAHGAALNEVKHQRDALREELKLTAPLSLFTALLDPISRSTQLMHMGGRLQWPKSFGPTTR